MVAVDVGYGQLVWALQSDPRVVVRDRTNVRTLTPDQIGGPADLTVADLSFISLSLVLPALTACTVTDLVPMVKPQFEVGRQRLGRGGVVREPELRAESVLAVAAYRAGAGLGNRRGRPQPAARAQRQRGILPVAAPGRRPGRRGHDPRRRRGGRMRVRTAGGARRPLRHPGAGPRT